MESAERPIELFDLADGSTGGCSRCDRWLNFETYVLSIHRHTFFMSHRLGRLGRKSAREILSADTLPFHICIVRPCACAHVRVRDCELSRSRSPNNRISLRTCVYARARAHLSRPTKLNEQRRTIGKANTAAWQEHRQRGERRQGGWGRGGERVGGMERNRAGGVGNWSEAPSRASQTEGESV